MHCIAFRKCFFFLRNLICLFWIRTGLEPWLCAIVGAKRLLQITLSVHPSVCMSDMTARWVPIALRSTCWKPNLSTNFRLLSSKTKAHKDKIMQKKVFPLICHPPKLGFPIYIKLVFCRSSCWSKTLPWLNLSPPLSSSYKQAFWRL